MRSWTGALEARSTVARGVVVLVDREGYVNSIAVPADRSYFFTETLDLKGVK
jgi:hypothetical protein